MTRKLIDYLAPWLLEHPDALEVNESTGERGETILELTPHPDDMGKIIGRRGRIIRAIRLLARTSSQAKGENVMVEVVD